MTWLRQHRWIIVAWIVGAGLRLYFLLGHSHIAGDSLIYGDLATNLLKHHVYGLSEGVVRSTLIRLPGYPIFLAACFAAFGIGNYISVLYVQLVLDLVTCGLLYGLARRVMGERAGLATLWLGMMCPFTANYIAAPLTETVSIFCTAVAFYSLERWGECAGAGERWSRWIWPMGLALAFAVLQRPDRSLVSVAVVPAMAWMAWRALGKKGLAEVAVVALIVLLPLTVWGVRNWRVFHVVQPLSPKYANDPGEFVSYGFQRWYRTWAVEFKSTDDIYWPYDGLPVAIGDLPSRAFDSAEERERTAKIFEKYNKVSSSTQAVDDAFGALAAERIAAHPVRYYVVLPFCRMANMWLRPRTEMLAYPMDWWRWRTYGRDSVEAAAYGALNLAYLLLAAVGLWRWRQQEWSGRRALAYALVGFVLMRSVMLMTVDNSEPRYTIDCYPVVILLAGFAVRRVVGVRGGRGLRRRRGFGDAA